MLQVNNNYFSIILFIIFEICQPTFQKLNYTSFQGSVVCFPSQNILYPKNLPELLEIVKNSVKNETRMKILGSRHSLTDIICTNGVPISLENFKNFLINENESFVTVGAGEKMSIFLKKLHQNGYGVLQTPQFGGITIGGALATAAHGSSLKYQSSLSSLVISMTIIDGLGNIHEITENEDLQGFRSNLGLLGIVTQVKLKIIPQYKIHGELVQQSDSILVENPRKLLNIAQNHDSFHLFWFPNQNSIILWNFNNILGNPDSHVGNAFSNFILMELNHLVAWTFHQFAEFIQIWDLSLAYLEAYTMKSLYTKVVGRSPIFTENNKNLENPFVGFSHQVLTSNCDEGHCVWDLGILYEEVELQFDLEQFDGVLKNIQKIMNLHKIHFPMLGILMRFSKKSEDFMSFNYGRDTFTIEWVHPKRRNEFKTPIQGLAAYQAIMQTLINENGARLHWGKNGLVYHTKEIIEKSRSPGLQKFRQLMKKFDTNGIFVNSFGERILGISNKMDVHPEMVHCAIQDHCICQSDFDCGGNRIICSQINGYNVCEKLKLNISN